MLILLPFFCFALTILLYFKLFKKTIQPFSWRESILLSFITLGAFIVISTELLSTIHCLNIYWLTTTWIVFFISLFYVNQTLPKQKLHFSLPNFSKYDWFLLTGIGIILFATGLTAIIAPPNNYDSMTYHMPRVMHWLQNQTVANYPTSEIRQLWTNPFSEYIILHFQILSGSDRFANLIQWLVFVGTIITSSLLCTLWKADRKTQIIAALITTTIPMAILQSSSTQNDLLTSLYIFITIYFGFKFFRSQDLKCILITGISAGLAVLAKSTGYIFLGPFIIFITFFTLQKVRPVKKLLITFILLFLPILIINSGYFYRNIILGGNPLSPVASAKNVKCEIFGLPVTFVNVMRNIGSNLVFPSKKLNFAAEQLIFKAQNKLGIKEDDSRIFYYSYPFKISQNIYHEDYAPNPFHIFLIFISFILCFILPNKKSIKVYFLFNIISFILFSSLLKWQPWITRLQLPFFIILSPAIAIILLNIRQRYITSFLLITAFILAAPVAFQNDIRRIISKKHNIFTSQRFALQTYNNNTLQNNYLDIASYIHTKQFKNIGFDISGESLIYPLWVALEPKKHHYRMEYTQLVDNSPTLYPLGNFNPEVIVSRRPLDAFKLQFQNALWIKTQKSGEYHIFEADPSGHLMYQTTINNLLKTVKNLNQPIQSLFNKSTPEQIIYQLNNQLDIALTINPEVLDLLIPEFGKNFTDAVINGMSQRLQGIMTRNQKYFESGQNKLSQWSAWFNKNQNKILPIIQPEIYKIQN